MNPIFDHERLDVYQEAISFIAWISVILESEKCVGDIRNQLDRASISIVLNIAEGNGKFTAKDRCRFFDNAHGSALECAAGLDVMVAKGWFALGELQDGKSLLQRIVQMLFGLIKRLSNRTYGKQREA